MESNVSRTTNPLSPDRMEASNAESPALLTDDATLVTACINGDPRAWEQLLTRYGRMIYTIPLRMEFSTAATEEIYQEVCLILFEKLATFANQSQLSTWIYTITRRACIRRWRQRQELTVFDDLETMGAGATDLEERLLLIEEQEQVHQAVESLDLRCRTLLYALFFETTTPSYTTLARELDVPVGSIGPIRARCLEKLKQVMIKLDRGDPG